MGTRASVLSAVERALRIDLKLGQLPVDESLRLVDGELPLDSLDLLLLVTSTEKQLGIKLPSGQLGRETMETVGAFVDFVAAHMAASAGTPRS